MTFGCRLEAAIDSLFADTYLLPVGGGALSTSMVGSFFAV